ncbi:MAG: leucine-rich repeat domain-containing protein [Bacteroidales bacterium]|nr:leucine-rich repeat domain-containing protein [Bacteroidales bacterium]
MTKRILLSLILCGGVVFSAFAATEIDGIYYSFSGSGSNRKATVTYETSSYNSYSGDIVIPSSVYYNNYNYPITNIGMHAFDLCSGLTSVTIPSSVTAIEMYAFKDCTGLTTIDIPSSVTSIGSNAFLNCTALTSINGQSSVTSISANAFKGCTSLESITVLGNINEIPMSTFEGCSSLTAMPIPNSVLAIRGTAFKDCIGLTSITIPSSVTTINANAFQGCTALTEINYNVTTLSDFSNSSLPFKGCTSSNITVNIGFNVEYIPAYTFSGIDVTEITIPSSVTSIGNNAFGNFTKLSTVYMLSATPPTLANNSVFKTSYSTYCNIKVFYSSDGSILKEYKDETYWSDFSSNISETNSFTVTNMDLTGITSPVTIPAGNTITVTGTATNPTAAKLVIEDGGQLAVSSSGIQATFQKGITGYTSTKDSYYLIANPTTTNLNPEDDIENMLANEYDLFYFDESQEGEEWRNYKQDAFNLVNGKGYLYANSEDFTLSFAGTVPTGTSSSVTLNLKGTGTYAGFNLVGNPMSVNITSMNIGGSACSYYKLNPTTGVFAVSSDPIIVGEAFMVEADEDGATLNLNPGSKDESSFNNDIIRLEVSNNKYTDVAYLYFGNHLPLTKINHLNDEAPMLYIHNEKADQAVAVMNNRSEVKSVNVNFEAKTMGSYTISGKAEKGNFSYMHLYDRLTGADTDLLISDYTFIGSQTDAADRFILRFEAIGNNSESESFAYQNGSDIIINGEGELQIFDVMGRIVSKQYVNGVGTWRAASVQNGVYILKLNGMTQKIVVK